MSTEYEQYHAWLNYVDEYWKKKNKQEKMERKTMKNKNKMVNEEWGDPFPMSEADFDLTFINTSTHKTFWTSINVQDKEIYHEDTEEYYQVYTPYLHRIIKETVNRFLNLKNKKTYESQEVSYTRKTMLYLNDGNTEQEYKINLIIGD